MKGVQRSSTTIRIRFYGLKVCWCLIQDSMNKYKVSNIAIKAK